MSYIFFDLEWNQGYPHSQEERLDEIIQIGAYRLDSWEPRCGEVQMTCFREVTGRRLELVDLFGSDVDADQVDELITVRPEAPFHSLAAKRRRHQSRAHA